MSEATTWTERVRTHAGKIVIGGTGSLLALSLVTLGSALTSDGASASERQDATLIKQLEQDAESAEAALRTRHDQLLDELAGTDVERVARDEIRGRRLLLDLVDSSASSRTVRQTQVLLDARYTFFDTNSRTLTQFIPQWMAATDSKDGPGRMFTLAELDIEVRAVQGLTYAYAGLARLDPVLVDPSTPVKSEYLFLTFTTNQDGTVKELDVYRASNRTRDALAGPADDPASGDKTATPSPSTTPN